MSRRVFGNLYTHVGSILKEFHPDFVKNHSEGVFQNFTNKVLLLFRDENQMKGGPLASFTELVQKFFHVVPQED